MIAPVAVSNAEPKVIWPAVAGTTGVEAAGDGVGVGVGAGFGEADGEGLRDGVAVAAAPLGADTGRAVMVG